MGAFVYIEVFLQFKSFPAVIVIANPLLLLRMGLLVSFQRTLLHKFFTTNGALKRFLPSVGPNVTC